MLTTASLMSVKLIEKNYFHFTKELIRLIQFGFRSQKGNNRKKIKSRRNIRTADCERKCEFRAWSIMQLDIIQNVYTISLLRIKRMNEKNVKIPCPLGTCSVLALQGVNNVIGG